MSTTSSPVVTTSCEIPNIYVLIFNFWKEKIRCVHLAHICIRRAGFCCNPETSRTSGWLYCCGNTLRETPIKTSIASLFKCECTAKSIGNFCEIAPIKQWLHGSCHFIAVSQGAKQLFKLLKIERYPNNKARSKCHQLFRHLMVMQTQKWFRERRCHMQIFSEDNSNYFFYLWASPHQTHILCGLQLGKATENNLLCRFRPQTYTCLHTTRE